MKTVGILIFDQVEVLDFCGPFEVFSVAGRLAASNPDEPVFRVLLIAEQTQPMTTVGGMIVQPHFTMGTCPTLDVLLVPGGWGTRREYHNAQLIGWIEQQASQIPLTTAVCTGALLLAKAGLLDGRPATTHWNSLDWLARDFPTVAVQRDVRWVDDGQIVTSAGISAGIDMALHLVARLQSLELAQKTAQQMQYEWIGDTPQTHKA